jgi:hypothetical protein
MERTATAPAAGALLVLLIQPADFVTGKLEAHCRRLMHPLADKGNEILIEYLPVAPDVFGEGLILVMHKFKASGRHKMAMDGELADVFAHPGFHGC